MVSRTYDTHPEEAINCAKFDVCTPSSFEGVDADRHTHSPNCTLYISCIYKLNALIGTQFIMA